MRTSTEPTDADLKKGLADVGYEIDQMYEAYCLCKNASENAQARANAYFESFLLHVRNLWEFYLPKRKKPDTINAFQDYGFKDSDLWMWFKNHDDLYIKLHQRLAHLSFLRPSRSSSDREWSNEEMFENIFRCTENFIKHLLENFDPSERDKWEDRKKRLGKERSSSEQLQFPQEIRDTYSTTHFGQIDNKD